MKCTEIQPLLSEFLDNALSARATWEVDKHVAECNRCASELNDLRRTVSLLAEAPRFEVSDDFMAKLQSRINAVEPAPARAAWLNHLAQLFRPRVLPVWGAAAGACALAVLMLVRIHPARVAPAATAAAPEPAMVRAASTQNLAVTASEPFEDVSATNLAAHTGAADGETETEGQE